MLPWCVVRACDGDHARVAMQLRDEVPQVTRGEGWLVVGFSCIDPVIGQLISQRLNKKNMIFFFFCVKGGKIFSE